MNNILESLIKNAKPLPKEMSPEILGILHSGTDLVMFTRSAMLGPVRVPNALPQLMVKVVPETRAEQRSTYCKNMVIARMMGINNMWAACDGSPESRQRCVDYAMEQMKECETDEFA